MSSAATTPDPTLPTPDDGVIRWYDETTHTIGWAHYRQGVRTSLIVCVADPEGVSLLCSNPDVTTAPSAPLRLSAAEVAEVHDLVRGLQD